MFLAAVKTDDATRYWIAASGKVTQRNILTADFISVFLFNMTSGGWDLTDQASINQAFVVPQLSQLYSPRAFSIRGAGRLFRQLCG
jgi:hypothetical protein